MKTKLFVRGRWVVVRWFLPLLFPLLTHAQTPAKVLERPVAEWQDVAGKSLTITYRLTTADSLGATAVVRDETDRLRISVPVTSSAHEPGSTPNQVLALLLPAGNALPPGRYVVKTLLTAGPSAQEGRVVLVQRLILFKNPTTP